LYEAEGNFAAAREQYLALAGRGEPRAARLALLIDFLLRRGRAAEAEPWLARLRASAPATLDALRLEARWLQALGRDGEIESRVETYAAERWKTLEDEQAVARFCLEIGNLYRRVEMYEPARRWREKLAARKPQAYGPLAECLAAMGRLPEAIDLCQNKWEAKPSPRAAIVLASLLGRNEPAASDSARAEALIEAALKKFPDDAPLLFAAACLRTARGRDDDAAALYARVCQLRPRHVPALNNLAAVLSDRPRRREEALGYINRAIDLSGPRPALLDTKAMVLLESDPRQAVALLRAAESQFNPDPRHHLHMARAHQLLGDPVQARAALQQARANDLDRAALTRGDARMLEQLEAALREKREEGA
jgi:tetratricopeptide (TPR) repeat protein